MITACLSRVICAVLCVSCVSHVRTSRLTSFATRRLGHPPTFDKQRSRTTARRQGSPSRRPSSSSTACWRAATASSCRAASARLFRAAANSSCCSRHPAGGCCAIANVQSSAGGPAQAASSGTAEGDGESWVICLGRNARDDKGSAYVLEM